MSEKDVIKETRPRMEAAVEDLRKKLGTIRTGRAAVSLLDSVVVEKIVSEVGQTPAAEAEAAGRGERLPEVGRAQVADRVGEVRVVEQVDEEEREGQRVALLLAAGA